jgi:hypothetical protein
MCHRRDVADKAGVWDRNKWARTPALDNNDTLLNWSRLASRVTLPYNYISCLDYLPPLYRVTHRYNTFEVRRRIAVIDHNRRS